MYIKLLILFSIPLCSGLCMYLMPDLPTEILKLLLVFGGSYLFSFMLVHLLPQLFAHTAPAAHATVGICLLLGFFLQIFLDFFSKGLAHGHIHVAKHSAALQLSKAIPLTIALCLHALLDGVLLNLSAPALTQPHYGSGLLLGILLHKVPIAFILTGMLSHLDYNKKTIFPHLLLFSLASPLGWALAYYWQEYALVSLQRLLIVRSIAIGNLLHIATTILFESNPQHQFNAQKLFAILLGGILAAVMVLL